MSLRLFISKFAHHGRIFFRSFRPHQELVGIGKSNILPKGQKIEAAKSVSPLNTGVFGLPSHLSSARKLFVDHVLKRVTNSLASELRRKTTKQLLSGNSAPFFALVGVSLASGTGIITKEDELDGVCWEIRVSNLLVAYKFFKYVSKFTIRIQFILATIDKFPNLQVFLTVRNSLGLFADGHTIVGLQMSRASLEGLTYPFSF